MFVWITLICPSFLFATSAADFLSLKDLDVTEKNQRNIINDYEENSYRYSTDDETQRLTYLCIRALIAAIKDNLQSEPEVEVFRFTHSGCQSVMPEYPKQGEPEQIRQKDLEWVNEYKFNVADPYSDVNFKDLLEDDKMLIFYYTENKGLDFTVTLRIIKKANQNEVCSLLYDYEFAMAYLADRCDEKEHKEAVDSFKDLVQLIPEFLLEKDDDVLFDNSSRLDMGWKLVNITNLGVECAKITEIGNNLWSMYHFER